VVSFKLDHSVGCFIFSRAY